MTYRALRANLISTATTKHGNCLRTAVAAGRCSLHRPSNSPRYGHGRTLVGAGGLWQDRKSTGVLREELRRDWRGVRYLVPTVGHKRSIEQLLLSGEDEHGRDCWAIR